MNKPTRQDADLMLKLYQQFEADRMRAARKWMATEFQVSTYERFVERHPRGSEGFDHFTGFCGFFEMIGTFFKHGLLHPDLIFEMWYINGFYGPVYPIIDGWRKQGDKHIAENFEILALAELDWIAKVKGEQYVPTVPYRKR
ncbi:DUF4760 domain-containing protein [Effusibacillus pohliae]|uniref:DUF4760 domain-containing protein n=1 Tax=Effusibacillus pohliae TaxID=232270 RepID=UPI00035D4A6E|nr:hypothetical protein [Effusibacillus pohliae]